MKAPQTVFNFLIACGAFPRESPLAHSCVHYFITPTCTFRNRAGAAPWPVWPI